MIVLTLAGLGLTVFGFIIGYVAAYYGTLKVILVTLNALIVTRTQTPDASRALELPGLTLFRSVVRSRQFVR